MAFFLEFAGCAFCGRQGRRTGGLCDGVGVPAMRCVIIAEMGRLDEESVLCS